MAAQRGDVSTQSFPAPPQTPPPFITDQDLYDRYHRLIYKVAWTMKKVTEYHLTDEDVQDIAHAACVTLINIPQDTMAGRPIVASIHATPGRVDGLCLKNWGRVENKPIDFLEFGGQTMFPTYGGSGGLNASTIFYLWTGMNIYNANVRAGTFIDSVAIPSGY
jgi:hypothetical protein